MGYAFGKTGLHTQDSDMAYDLHIEVQEAIVKILRKAEKVIENEFNTDGVLNVGMILQDLQPICNGDDVAEFMVKFIPRLEKYIQQHEKISAEEWGGSDNKNSHIRRYKSLLKNLQAKMKKVNVFYGQ